MSGYVPTCTVCRVPAEPLPTGCHVVPCPLGPQTVVAMAAVTVVVHPGSTVTRRRR